MSLCYVKKYPFVVRLSSDYVCISRSGLVNMLRIFRLKMLILRPIANASFPLRAARGIRLVWEPRVPLPLAFLFSAGLRRTRHVRAASSRGRPTARGVDSPLEGHRVTPKQPASLATV